MNKLPILLSSSVVPTDKDVKLGDPGERLFHTLESIAEWLKHSERVRLVVCDGSGFNFADVVAKKFPNAEIECLAFVNDRERVLKQGKGYGEGEIVKYAVENSRFIRQSGVFAKCTGKLWVENFVRCLDAWRGPFMGKAHFDNVFSLRPTRMAYFDTRFYMVEVGFYKKYFMDAHLAVGGNSGLSIEDCFMEIVVSQQMKHILFREQPIICGVGGGSGKYYKNSALRRLKDCLRAWLVRNSPRYAALF